MPLLEYRCADCGSLFERLIQARSQAEQSAATSCPGCGGTAKRVLSLFAAVRGGDGASTAGAAAGGCCGGSCGCGGGR
jgi:putative FmdB family regulatory protein